MRRIAVTLLIGLLISLCCFAQSTKKQPAPLSASISFSGGTQQASDNLNSKQTAIFAAILASPKYQEVLQSTHTLYKDYAAPCTANTTYTIPNFITNTGNTVYFFNGWSNNRCHVTVNIDITSESGAPALNLTRHCAFTPDSIRFLTSPNLQNTYSVPEVITFLTGLQKILDAECTVSIDNSSS